ncbi:exopolygalacturonase-like [Pyrus ussuriensis x Pyrus communis]|uniref:Exopolygalacturonase-like n=1 Tax=Pyrus ussuriensis x Pyrus communis TaxID=2448454 RepID=A0A5N5HFK8_9ROSA|nr:exopolygalacturonase-like [Pyrus ussuriensis x Pyrus communis]
MSQSQHQVHGTLQAPEKDSELTTNETWVGFENVDMITVSRSGTFDGQGVLPWSRKTAAKAKIVLDVSSLNSKNFHIHVFRCINVTFQHVHITAPGDSKNTDGIHIGKSTGINITHTNIGTGDDCVSIGDGSNQITVINVTCGPGHGISIGSLARYNNEESLAGIRVKNCTLTNTQNGVRIKTWPNSPLATTASDIHFEDIIMVNVGNPIVIDQLYCPYKKCDNLSPSKVKISNVSFKNIKGSSATALALKIVCSSGSRCENVELTDIDLTYNGAKGTLTSQCLNVKPTISGLISALACATSIVMPPPLI